MQNEIFSWRRALSALVLAARRQFLSQRRHVADPLHLAVYMTRSIASRSNLRVEASHQLRPPYYASYVSLESCINLFHVGSVEGSQFPTTLLKSVVHWRSGERTLFFQEYSVQSLPARAASASELSHLVNICSNEAPYIFK